MKSPILKVSLAFSHKPDAYLVTFATTVQSHLFGNVVFDSPPVTAKDLSDATEAFAKAKALQPSRGKAGTADKNNEREKLTDLLKKLAGYVEDTSNNDLALLLSSGFEANSTNRAPTVPVKPSILSITGGKSGEALVTMSTEKSTRGVEIRVAEVGEDGVTEPYRPTQFSTSSRRISVTGLTPGKLYAYQGRTVRGSTTYSDWSDRVVQRVM